MDTATQLVRAKYDELFRGELSLAEFSAWIESLPIPVTVNGDFKPFMRLVIGAQCRLVLWSAGAPEAMVIASLRWVVDGDGTTCGEHPDPLAPYKQRYVRQVVDGPADMW
jgi:hypothetical protein